MSCSPCMCCMSCWWSVSGAAAGCWAAASDGCATAAAAAPARLTVKRAMRSGEYARVDMNSCSGEREARRGLDEREFLNAEPRGETDPEVIGKVQLAY